MKSRRFGRVIQKWCLKTYMLMTTDASLSESFTKTRVVEHMEVHVKDSTLHEMMMVVRGVRMGCEH